MINISSVDETFVRGWRIDTYAVRITVLVERRVDSIVKVLKPPFPRVETDKAVDVLKEIIIPAAVLAELAIGPGDRVVPV